MNNVPNVKRNNMNGHKKYLFFNKGTQKHGFLEGDLLFVFSITAGLLPSILSFLSSLGLISFKITTLNKKKRQKRFENIFISLTHDPP
jgi:hypothetical protein